MKTFINETKLNQHYLNRLRGLKLTITGNELMLIADVTLGLWWDPVGVGFLCDEVAESETYFGYGAKWGVDARNLAAKLKLAPLSTLNELAADIQEAWCFHNISNSRSEFASFLRSRTYRFQALNEEPDRYQEWLVGAKLADGSIVIDRIPSHIPRGDFGPVEVALSKVMPDGRAFIEEEVLASGPIGTTKCIKTYEGDSIVFAQRFGRKGLTRFVKNRAPEPCSSVFVVLKRLKVHRYLIITGFVGTRPEPEPWDETAFRHAVDPNVSRQRSLEFWSKHALIYDETLIVNDSVPTGVTINGAC